MDTVQFDGGLIDIVLGLLAVRRQRQTASSPKVDRGSVTQMDAERR